MRSREHLRDLHHKPRKKKKKRLGCDPPLVGCESQLCWSERKCEKTRAQARVCVCPSGVVVSCLIVCMEISVLSECKYARCSRGESVMTPSFMLIALLMIHRKGLYLHESVCVCVRDPFVLFLPVRVCMCVCDVLSTSYPLVSS